MERKSLVIAILFFLCIPLFAQKGIVKGKITDKETGEEIVGATVVIVGTTIGTATDFNGDFVIGVEAGTFDFRCQFISYEPSLQQNITVKKDYETILNFEMVSAELKLDEVKVVARANRESETMLLIDQKISLVSKETIGARQLSIQGISDAASAVTRITGVARQEGSQSINVRGLGDRYNTTTLNGLPLPSNQAEYKNIDLALLPSDVIGYISVEKTFTPNLIGDVGGANVDVVSKYHTGDAFLEAGFSTGYNINLFDTGDFYLQKGKGFWGYDNTSIPYQSSITSYKFKNSWNPKKQTPSPDTDFSLSGGKTFSLAGGNLYFFAIGSFDNNYSFNETVKRKINGSDDIRMNAKGEEYNYETQSSGMINLNFSKGRSNLYLNSLFLNSSSQKLSNLKADRMIDVVSDESETALIRRAEYERNIIMVNQLMGKHNLSNGYVINWKFGFNHVNNIMPDRLHNIFIQNSNTGIYTPSTNDAANNNRYYHDLNEDEFSSALELSKSFGGEYNGKDFRGKFTLGYFGRYKSRDFEAYQYNFKLFDAGTIDPANPDAYFNDERMQQGFFSIITFYGKVNHSQSYSGSQLMNAGYFTLEYALSTKLTGLIGLRFEQVLQKVDYATSIKSGNNDFSEMNPFPSLSLRYAINEKQNLRFASSMSYTLPQFKETAPFLFEGITDAIVGNPYLYPSKIYNGELKWEMFPGGTEMLSVAVYGKYIQDPINRFVMASASNDFSYANSGDNAYVYGVEIELKKNLLEALATGGTRRLSAGFNASAMKTWQELDKVKVKSETKNFVIASFNTDNEVLEGAAPFLANANLTYHRNWTEKNFSYTASVNYGYTSERLYLIGSSSLGNQYDKCFNELNFNLNANVKKLGFSFSVKNILNPDYVRVQKNNAATHIVNSYSRGIKLGMGVSYKF